LIESYTPNPSIIQALQKKDDREGMMSYSIGHQKGSLTATAQFYSGMQIGD
jgi:hypothetical protein